MLACILIEAGGPAVAAAAPGMGSGLDEHLHQVIRLVGEDGETLLVTGFPLSIGDRFVTPSNRMYEVTGVDKGIARGRFVGGVRISWPGEPPLPRIALAWPLLVEAWPSFARALPPFPRAFSQAAAEGQPELVPRNPVGIYHTHSDESYVSTAGQTNVPWNGEIFQVGARLGERLRSLGLRVEHSYRRHDPHDGLAYTRSRRTAVQLLRTRPSALIDVHRDSPPAWVYRTEIGGQTMTSVLLVVGRQNPGLRANEAFAFSIKGFADRSYPRLIRGILYAAGDYNQDLHPRAILAEFGSTYNELVEAQRGAGLLGRVMPAVLVSIPGVPTGPSAVAREAQREASRRGWQTAAMYIILVGTGAVLFLILNEEGYDRLTEWRDRLLRRLRT